MLNEFCDVQYKTRFFFVDSIFQMPHDNKVNNVFSLFFIYLFLNQEKRGETEKKNIQGLNFGVFV